MTASASTTTSTFSDTVREHRSLARLVWPALLLALLGLLYGLTLCPTIYPGDGAELTAAAWSAGIPHPTGYPLFMMMGYAWMHTLAFAEPALMMNILTMLCALAGVLGSYQLTRVLQDAMRGDSHRETVLRWHAFAAALLVGAGAMWWSSATSTEVYALLMAFVSWIWAGGISLAVRPSRRKLFALAVLTGFSFLHHQLVLVTLPMTGVAIGTWIFSHHSGQSDPTEKRRQRKKRLRLLGWAVIAGLLPLAGYLYFPVRASAKPPINIGNPSNLERTIDHLRGGQFRQVRILTDPRGRPLKAADKVAHIVYRLEGIVVWTGLQVLGQDALSEAELSEMRGPAKPRIAHFPGAGFLGICLWALAALGFYYLARSNLLVMAGLLGGLVLNVLIVLIYTIVDIEVYQLPLWMLMVIFASFGLFKLLHTIRGSVFKKPTNSPLRFGSIVSGLLCCLLATVSIWVHRAGDNGVAKQHSTQAKVFADHAMRRLPENAVIFTTGDYDIYPLWYAQICEGKRSDVAVIGANFIFQGYYREMLKTTLPPGIEIYVNSRSLGGPEIWLTALIGGAIAPQLQNGFEVFMTGFSRDEQIRFLAAQGIRMQTAFVFESPAPDGVSMPLILYRVSADAPLLRRYQEIFLNSEWFPNAREKMLQSGR